MAHKTRNNAMEFPENRPVSLADPISLFFSLSLSCLRFSFCSFSFFFFGRSSFEIFHKVRLPLPTLSSSSLDRACWDASGIVLASRFRRIHRHGRLDFRSIARKERSDKGERKRERESLWCCVCFYLATRWWLMMVILSTRIHIPIISNNLTSQKCDEKWVLTLTKLQVLSRPAYLVWSDEFKN